MTLYGQDGREVYPARMGKARVTAELATRLGGDGWRVPVAILTGWAHACTGDRWLTPEDGDAVLCTEVGPEQGCRQTRVVRWIPRQ